MGTLVKYHDGDILSSNADIIVHQVNCLGIMGAGIAKQIRDKWPIVFSEYSKKCFVAPERRALLGDMQLVEVTDGKYVANCFGQLSINREITRFCMTDYNALRYSLERVRDKALELNVETIAVPYNLGCGLAGGNWETVLAIIGDTLIHKEFDLHIWRLS